MNRRTFIARTIGTAAALVVGKTATTEPGPAAAISTPATGTWVGASSYPQIKAVIHWNEPTTTHFYRHGDDEIDWTAYDPYGHLAALEWRHLAIDRVPPGQVGIIDDEQDAA